MQLKALIAKGLGVVQQARISANREGEGDRTLGIEGMRSRRVYYSRELITPKLS
ncbi:hypothetical protein [Coleofasciculus sp. F4-SAH-05]|uniref:hypothetical protein n=1 Tax=Coleofasciculus sp. F4-SAH-05 TaxID=3069525 RepID=UPI0032F947A9